MSSGMPPMHGGHFADRRLSCGRAVAAIRRSLNPVSWKSEIVDKVFSNWNHLAAGIQGTGRRSAPQQVRLNQFPGSFFVVVVVSEVPFRVPGLEVFGGIIPVQMRGAGLLCVASTVRRRRVGCID